LRGKKIFHSSIPRRSIENKNHSHHTKYRLEQKEQSGFVVVTRKIAEKIQKEQ